MRKLLIYIICLCLIVPAPMYEVKAAEHETKNLSIRRVNDGKKDTYKVVNDGENVYISASDLVQLANFDSKIIDMTGETFNQLIFTKKKDHHGFNQEIVISAKDNKISSDWYGISEFNGYLNMEDDIYLDIIKIFNYLRIKAEVVGNELLINIPVYTVLDFMIEDYQSALRNSVSQLDLLEAGESSNSSGFWDALTLFCSNFDFKLLIPGWGANALKNEQYLKAIQTLNEDDKVFYDENTNEYMKKELADRGFSGVLASGKDLANVMSIGGETIGTVEDVLNNLENLPESSQKMVDSYMDFVNWNGKTFDGVTELRAWSKHANDLSKVISGADIVVSAYETYSRAENWNEECLKNLEVLRNLEIDNYGEHKDYVKRIKTLVEQCYQEKENTLYVIAEQSILDVATVLLEKAFLSTTVGKVTDLFVLSVNTGVSVAECFGNVAEEMDKAELSYMVTCLINIAVASRIDAEIEYDTLDLTNLNSGKIEAFRDSIRTALKSNLRCWSYIYYLNRDGEWENSYRGKEVKSKINALNTYLTLLNESEKYDYALDDYDLIAYSPERIVNILEDSEKSSEYDINMLSGEWEIDEEQTMLANGMSMREMFGTSYKYGNAMKINEDYSFSYYIAAGIGGEGNWKIEENQMVYEIVPYEGIAKEEGVILVVFQESANVSLVMKCFEYNIYWKKSGNNVSVFEDMPKKFVFSSGVGAWRTEIRIENNGRFIGQYKDSTIDVGENYPNGMVYICDFVGKFSTPKQVDTHTYSMNLEYLEISKPVGEVYYKDGIKYVCSEPYGFDDANEFMMYLPGIKISNLPEGFVSWLSAKGNIAEKLCDYGIYNISGEEGFVSCE